MKVNRLMAAVEYGRPLSQHWNGTLGVNFQRANCLDDHNQPMTKVMTKTVHCIDIHNRRRPQQPMLRLWLSALWQCSQEQYQRGFGL